jgi:hypothetical protein
VRQGEPGEPVAGLADHRVQAAVDGHGPHAHQSLAGPRDRIGHLLVPQDLRAAVLTEDDGLHDAAPATSIATVLVWVNPNSSSIPSSESVPLPRWPENGAPSKCRAASLIHT